MMSIWVGSVVSSVVGPVTVAVVAVVSISLSLGLWLSISGPLAVGVGMSIWVSSVVSGISVVETRVGIRIIVGTIEEGRISLGFSISSPLAVVAMSIWMSIGSVSVGSVASVGVSGVAVAVGTIEEGRISLSLRLGLGLTGDEGGKANHKSELHCYLSA